jgi:hypothetical protein
VNGCCCLGLAQLWIYDRRLQVNVAMSLSVCDQYSKRAAPEDHLLRVRTSRKKEM